MSKVGSYDHLNESDPIRFSLDLESAVHNIVKSNYGIARLLSALVRQASMVKKRGPITDTIEKMLNEGEYC